MLDAVYTNSMKEECKSLIHKTSALDTSPVW
jgi:hypothetical protein